MTEPSTRGREGDVIGGKYRIGTLLGSGAMGEVYAAQHLLLGQKVAIKFLKPQASSYPEAISRFLREARAAARIASPHVVRMLDVAVENDVPYIVMEYLEGCDLAEWLRRHGALPVDQAIDFILQACEGLREAHALDIIHRDIKPPNLFAVQRAGAPGAIKVLDFGISKMVTMVPSTIGPGEWKPGSVVTEERTMMGSPYYMSPEQMESARDVDARTDVWALGVTLYELLTGTLPFDGRSLLQVYSKIASDAPLRLRELSPKVPPAVEAVIVKCLQRDRDRRYASVIEMATALGGDGVGRALTRLDRPVPSPSTQTLEISQAPPSSELTAMPRAEVPASRAGAIDKTLSSSGLPAAPARPRRGAPMGLALLVLTAPALVLMFRMSSEEATGQRGAISAAPAGSSGSGAVPSPAVEPPVGGAVQTTGAASILLVAAHPPDARARPVTSAVPPTTVPRRAGGGPSSDAASPPASSTIRSGSPPIHIPADTDRPPALEPDWAPPDVPK